MGIQRIIDNTTEDANGCWVWNKSCNSAGYGQLTEDKVYWLAHRYSYACTNPNLADFEVVRHLCHNPRCCNPDHLITESHKENWYDSVASHKEASDLRRNSWEVNGVKYLTIRDAQVSTGISMSALVKHTEYGVFNLNSYREACKKSRCRPKL